MKVRVSDIGPDGLIINDTIPLEPLNSRLNECKTNDIVFTSTPKVALKVNSTTHGAETHGKVSARYKQPCSLCLKEVDKQLEVDAEYIFQKRAVSAPDSETTTDLDNYIDDIGITYFAGEHIELEELIQESLILALSPFWRPPQGCDGACTICGINPSNILKCKSSKEAEDKGQEKPTTNFGQLLKIAGVK